MVTLTFQEHLQVEILTSRNTDSFLISFVLDYFSRVLSSEYSGRQFPQLKAELFAVEFNKDKPSFWGTDWPGMLAVHYKRLKFHSLKVSHLVHKPTVCTASILTHLHDGLGMWVGKCGEELL